MAVLDCGDKLLEEVARLVLRNVKALGRAPRGLVRCKFGRDVGGQGAPGHVLHGEGQVRGREEDLVKADDVPVPLTQLHGMGRCGHGRPSAPRVPARPGGSSDTKNETFCAHTPAPESRSRAG